MDCIPYGVLGNVCCGWLESALFNVVQGRLGSQRLRSWLPILPLRLPKWCCHRRLISPLHTLRTLRSVHHATQHVTRSERPRSDRDTLETIFLALNVV